MAGSLDGWHHGSRGAYLATMSLESARSALGSSVVLHENLEYMGCARIY